MAPEEVGVGVEYWVQQNPSDGVVQTAPVVEHESCPMTSSNAPLGWSLLLKVLRETVGSDFDKPDVRA